jgi:hypothetical protein
MAAKKTAMAAKKSVAGLMARETAGTDAIEIKLTVVESQEKAVLERFKLERGKGEQRRIYFYDTPKLALYTKGVVLRARETVGEGCDSTVKIRPVVPEKVGAAWHQKSGFKVEADAVGEKIIRSASFTTPQNDKELDQVVSGARPIDKLFSGEQEAFLDAFCSVKVDYGKLVALGPIASLRWKFKNKGLPYEICAEEWRLPNGRDLLELSIKASSEASAAARGAFVGFLRELGFDVDPGQRTKTRTALEYLSHGA